MPRRLSPGELDLYDHVPPDVLRRARIAVVPVLTPNADAMTLGRLVLIRRGHESSTRLLAHELVHVQQWADLGVVRFLTRYLGSYVGNLVRMRRHRAAYLAIPLEEQARDRARDCDERHRPG